MRKFYFSIFPCDVLKATVGAGITAITGGVILGAVS